MVLLIIHKFNLSPLLLDTADRIRPHCTARSSKNLTPDIRNIFWLTIVVSLKEINSRNEILQNMKNLMHPASPIFAEGSRHIR